MIERFKCDYGGTQFGRNGYTEARSAGNNFTVAGLQLAGAWR